ncbi:MAG: hypothetical protein NZT61_04605, partial [Deltaproteobacteria bacterium]|nr:hypothetical protein [Deltaproteobacteria bacterium]
MQQPQQIVEDQVADCLANLTGNEKKSVLAGLKKLHESLVKLEEKAGGETNFYDAVGRHRLQLLHNSNDIGKYM